MVKNHSVPLIIHFQIYTHVLILLEVEKIGVLAPGVIFDKDIVIRIGGIRYKFWL